MKISVLTPSYNSGKYIARAIESVLSQNHTDWEHIIVDGGSNDETGEILNSYQHLTWVSESDRGQADAMNKAFGLSSGDIIVYLNADDWFESTVFNEVESYFNTDSNLDVLVGNLYFRGIRNHFTKLGHSEHRIRRIILPFKYGFPYNPVSYFYKRHVQEEIGPFPIDDHYAMDFWFILKAFSSRYNVCKSELVFGTYFDSGENKSSTNSDISLLPYVRESLVSDNRNLRLYFNFHFVIYRLFHAPFQFLTNLLRCTVVLLLRRKFVSLKGMKESGLKYWLQK